MNTHTNIKEGICHQQQKIIASLRKENKELTQRVELLEEIREELLQLKSAFASNGNLTYFPM